MSSLLENTMVIATMHHPRISVVISVEREWITYSDRMKEPRTLAPSVPRRYPIMLTMMTTAAVNSTFSPCLRQMISDSAIVRIVRKSSSSMPASLHKRATAACIRAKTCMIPDIFIGLMNFNCNWDTKIMILLVTYNFSFQLIAKNLPFVTFFNQFVRRRTRV